jgi:hypothetical protein
MKMESEKKLLGKIQDKEFQYSEIRMITCDLQRQSKLNSDAFRQSKQNNSEIVRKFVNRNIKQIEL